MKVMRVLMITMALIGLTDVAHGDPTALKKVLIGIAGNAYPYSYYCDANGKLDMAGSEFCGVEIKLMQRICADQSLECQWARHKFAKSPEPETKKVYTPLDQEGILFDLITPAACADSDCASADDDSRFPYDVVLGSIATSAARRPYVLFSVPYYTAPNILIGNKVDRLFAENEVDGNGFPPDRMYFSEAPERKLKIGVLPGSDLYVQIRDAYPNAQHIEIIQTGTFAEDLVAGKIDLAMAWQGVEQKVRNVVSGGSHEQFGIVSVLKTVRVDSRNAVGLAFRPTAQGLSLAEIFNKGIIKSRAGGGGYHRELFLQMMGADLWPCQSAPYLNGDPKCAETPE